MASISPVNSGRQSYKGFIYNPSVATQCTFKKPKVETQIELGLFSKLLITQN